MATIIGKTQQQGDREAAIAAIRALRDVLRFDYAQWVVEDEETRDFRVLASLLPAGKSGYEIAHRTGVIGQVFRYGRSVFFGQATGHPLYDPYDSAVTWELAIPLEVEGRLAAVLNLEGRSDPVLNGPLWGAIGESLRQVGCWKIPEEEPTEGQAVLADTALVAVARGGDLGSEECCWAIGRAMADQGLRVIVGVGPLKAPPDSPCGQSDTSSQSLAERFSGKSLGLDFLRLEGLPTSSSEVVGASWWRLVEGRYQLAVVATCSGM